MPSDDLVAFIDESLKPVRGGESHGGARPASVYAVAAVVVLRQDVDSVRRELRSVAERYPRGLHYRMISPRGRRECLQAVDMMPDWDAIVVETNRAVPVRNDRQLRAAVLQAAFMELWRRHGVRDVTLESRAMVTGQFAPLDRDDEHVAARLRTVQVLPQDFRLTHGTKSERLLGLADLVVGARTDHLCGVDYVPWSVIAHRVITHSVTPRYRPHENAEAPGR